MRNEVQVQSDGIVKVRRAANMSMCTLRPDRSNRLPGVVPMPIRYAGSRRRVTFRGGRDDAAPMPILPATHVHDLFSAAS